MDIGEKIFNKVYEKTVQQNHMLREKIKTLFDAIKHGDDTHQEWLKSKIEEHFKDENR